MAFLCLPWAEYRNSFDCYHCGHWYNSKTSRQERYSWKDNRKHWNVNKQNISSISKVLKTIP